MSSSKGDTDNSLLGKTIIIQGSDVIIKSSDTNNTNVDTNIDTNINTNINTDSNENKPQTKKLNKNKPAQKHYITKGLSGLTNLGNTCYANSIIQALSNTDSFMAYFIRRDSKLREELLNRVIDKQAAEKEKQLGHPVINYEIDLKESMQISKDTISYKLGNIFRFMWAVNAEIKPCSLRKQIIKHIPMFKGNSQADAQEFLSALLDRIDEESKGKCTIENILTPKQTQMKEYLTNLGAEISQKYSILMDLDKKKVITQKKIDDLQEEVKLNINISDSTSLFEEELMIQKNSFERQMAEITKRYDIIFSEYKKIVEEINIILKNNPKEFMLLEAFKAYERLYKDSYSIINDIFSGLHLTVFTCDTCSMVSFRFERSDILTLSLYDPTYVPDKEYSLKELIEHFISQETLNSSNSKYCGYCMKKTTTNKKTHLYSLPDKLVIMIKKYQQVPDDHRFPERLRKTYVKTSSKVKYPFELDCSSFISEYSFHHDSNITDKSNINVDTDEEVNEFPPKKSSKYSLYACVRHSGGLEGGHYYSYAKNHINNKWYRFDDDKVYWVEDEEEVLKSNGYILFYERK